MPRARALRMRTAVASSKARGTGRLQIGSYIASDSYGTLQEPYKRVLPRAPRKRQNNSESAWERAAEVTG